MHLGNSTISRSSITALIVAMSGTAAAAAPSSDSDPIEEVVVTAGTRARVGYLTNVPRTYGVSLRFNF